MEVLFGVYLFKLNMIHSTSWKDVVINRLVMSLIYSSVYITPCMSTYQVWEVVVMFIINKGNCLKPGIIFLNTPTLS